MRATTIKTKEHPMALADILADHPDRETFDLAALHRAPPAAAACALACSACADSDLGRDAAAMATCIRTCTDCADVCMITAKLLSRPAPRGTAWAKLVKGRISPIHRKSSMKRS